MHARAAGPCVLCGAGGVSGGLCAACRASLPRLPAAQCRRCASPLMIGEVCGACLQRPPRYDGVVACFVYDFPVDTLIHAYKYRGDLRLTRLLGADLGPQGGAPIDLIVPMPLSDARLRLRGYNQALELARESGSRHGLPVLSRACRRVKDTPPQALLPWKERAANVRGAFVCDADVRGKRVAVVDDVLTTGATLDELARNLKRAGAAAVYGWVVARAVRRAYRPAPVERGIG